MPIIRVIRKEFLQPAGPTEEPKISKKPAGPTEEPKISKKPAEAADAKDIAYYLELQDVHKDMFVHLQQCGDAIFEEKQTGESLRVYLCLLQRSPDMNRKNSKFHSKALLIQECLRLLEVNPITQEDLYDWDDMYSELGSSVLLA